VSDIDTAVVDSLKVLDPKWPIREADIKADIGFVCYVPCVDGARGAREKSGISAKRSGAAMYSACFAWRITSVAMQPLWPLALM
jgi:hypothetical protein